MSETEAKVPCQECGKLFSPTSMRKHQRTQHPDKFPPQRPGRRKKTAVKVSITADEIVEAVLPVVYADGMVPLAHLPHIAAFRSAATAFLREVSS